MHSALSFVVEMAKSDTPREAKNPSEQRLAEGLTFVEKRLQLLEPLVTAEPKSDEWQRWLRVTLSGIREYFGSNSEELAWATPSRPRPTISTAFTSEDQLEARRQDRYDQSLSETRNGLKSILDKHDAISPATLPAAAEPLTVVRAFLSHGGFRPSLEAVERFLRGLGVEPIVVERESSEGREVNENVDHHRDQCDFAIVIWSKDIEDAKGSWLPSGSVQIEAGELREQFGSRIIFLREEGVSLPTLASTITFQSFREDDMAPAFQKIVTELRDWGWLAISPA